MANTKVGNSGRVKRKRSPSPGSWKYSAGRRPYTLTAYEREDRKMEIWIRYGGGKHRQKLHDSIRDAKQRIDPTLESTVISQAAQAQLSLSRGAAPLGAPVAAPAAPNTLREAFDKALVLGDGIYATATSQWRDMRTLAADICSLLGENTPVEEIKTHHAAILWRKIAAETQKGRKRTLKNKGGTRQIPWGGFRMGVRAVDFLFRTLRFMAEKESKNSPPLPKYWQATMRTDWENIVGSVPGVARPRYSEVEMDLMLASLPQADPRLGLLLELAAEARLGQARLCMRSHLDITPGAGALLYGQLLIPGRGKKRGTIIDLTKEQRQIIDNAIGWDYLSTAEPYFPGQDYPLFPGGRLVKGRMPIRYDVTTGKYVIKAKPVTKDGLRGWFQDYETKLGIPHIDGRGWYGVRRRATDVAENTMTDQRALNLLTGHASDRMRREYQDELDPMVRRLAAQTRSSIRKRVQPVPQPVPNP